MELDVEGSPTPNGQSTDDPLVFPSPRSPAEQQVIERLQTRTRSGYLVCSFLGLGSFYLFGGFRALFALAFILFPCFYPIPWMVGIYWATRNEEDWRRKLVKDAAWELRRLRSGADATPRTAVPVTIAGHSPSGSTAAEKGEYHVLSARLDKDPVSPQLNAAMLKLAESGNGHACFDVAAAMDLGVGSGQDATQAAQWFTRAADLGNPSARALLTEGLLTGRWPIEGGSVERLQLVGYMTEREIEGVGLQSEVFAAVLKSAIARAVQVERVRATGPLQMLAKYVPLDGLDLSPLVVAMVTPISMSDLMYMWLSPEGILPIRTLEADPLGALVQKGDSSPGPALEVRARGSMAERHGVHVELQVSGSEGPVAIISGTVYLPVDSGSTTKQVPDRRYKAGFREEQEFYTYDHGGYYRFGVTVRRDALKMLVQKAGDLAARPAVPGSSAHFRIPTRFARNAMAAYDSGAAGLGVLGLRYRPF